MNERDNIRYLPVRQRRLEALPRPENTQAMPVSKLLHELQDMSAEQDYFRGGNRITEINHPTPELAEQIGLDMARRIRLQLRVIEKLGLTLPGLLVKLHDEEERR